jgi:hypothetical protein
MKTLRPCPFCRHSDQLELRWLVKGGHFIKCLHCLASGPRNGDENDCIDDWNYAIRKFDFKMVANALAEAGYIENLIDGEAEEISVVIATAIQEAEREKAQPEKVRPDRDDQQRDPNRFMA